MKIKNEIWYGNFATVIETETECQIKIGLTGEREGQAATVGVVILPLSVARYLSEILREDPVEEQQKTDSEPLKNAPDAS